MARTTVDDAAELRVADVLHKRSHALPANITVGEVRAWFEESTHRRMAFLADEGRYAGSVTKADLVGDDDRPAVDVAQQGPTIAPEAKAMDAHKLALSDDARRLPVVDGDGMLVGVMAVTDDNAGFCGTS
ncbi:MAG TPA: CBS domain-containing protein [Solirubrobacteraceae bacterium]|jgi:CBS domain-containing protein